MTAHFDLSRLNDRTLFTVSTYCFAAGALWGAVSATAIYLGSTLLPPRLRRRQIWEGWRKKRLIWAGALVLPSLASVLTGEWIARAIGFHNLYWYVRGADLIRIARVGGAAGYLFFLCVVVFLSMLAGKVRKPTS